MQEEHRSGLCPALCKKCHLGYVMTSRGHDRKRFAIAERSTPDYAGARAWLGLSHTVLVVGLLAVEPVDDASQQCGLMRSGGGHSFFCGRLAGTVYARILPQSTVQMGTAPSMELNGPRPRVNALERTIRGFTSRSAD